VEVHLGIVSVVTPSILRELQLVKTRKKTNLEPVQHGCMEGILMILFMKNIHTIFLQHFKCLRFPTI
jgi:hypothetical protein